ncbi:MAG: AbrB/MazE/SpoVT family DNA-binding domain-containing protein [Oscillospiraceae bacterium]|nr:AbrB/MazE/SpoVT family DNA-binding domain-containing protein [Oscillospiraceae bacterium]
MKATGIVRRIDDLGRVVIPKEIRRTMRIREGDPLEIYTTKEGEVIFKKYSLLGGLEDFAAQFCDTLNRSTDFTTAITDRDSIIAVAGAPKRELLGKTLSESLEKLMEQRQVWRWETGAAPVSACVGTTGYYVAVAAPILSAGDVLGLVLFLAEEGVAAGETEHKLAQTVAAFLGKNMEE